MIFSVSGAQNSGYGNCSQITVLLLSTVSGWLEMLHLTTGAVTSVCAVPVAVLPWWPCLTDFAGYYDDVQAWWHCNADLHHLWCSCFINDSFILMLLAYSEWMIDHLYLLVQSYPRMTGNKSGNIKTSYLSKHCTHAFPGQSHALSNR